MAEVEGDKHNMRKVSVPGTVAGGKAHRYGSGGSGGF